MSAETSHATQDYLKAIFLIQEEARVAGEPGKPVSTKALSDRMAVSAASGTNMMKRLGALGLVRHVPYKGAELTEAGRKVALEVIRHHRLLETYLAEALGVPWDQVHAEAEILEHVLSEDLEERIAARLGHPTTDPHGHPIPSRDLAMPSASERRLWEVGDGTEVAVERVSDAFAEALRYLDGLGIRPGARIEVVGRGPLSGPLFVRIGKKSEDVKALSKEISEAVWVA
jgi:DtxR family Mn-dependent transcriptional regulator